MHSAHFLKELVLFTVSNVSILSWMHSNEAFGLDSRPLLWWRFIMTCTWWNPIFNLPHFTYQQHSIHMSTLSILTWFYTHPHCLGKSKPHSFKYHAYPYDFKICILSPWHIRFVHPTAHSRPPFGCIIDISNNISQAELLLSSNLLFPLLFLFTETLVTETPNLGMVLDSSLFLRQYT